MPKQITCLSCCDTNIKLEALGAVDTTTARVPVPTDSSHTYRRPSFGKANKSSPKLSSDHCRSGSVCASPDILAGLFHVRRPVIDTPAL